MGQHIKLNLSSYRQRRAKQKAKKLSPTESQPTVIEKYSPESVDDVSVDESIDITHSSLPPFMDRLPQLLLHLCLPQSVTHHLEVHVFGNIRQTLYMWMCVNFGCYNIGLTRWVSRTYKRHIKQCSSKSIDLKVIITSQKGLLHTNEVKVNGNCFHSRPGKLMNHPKQEGGHQVSQHGIGCTVTCIRN